MTRFEHTRYFRLLSPFIYPLLHRLLFRDERYVLYFSQILLSGLLYLLADGSQQLLLALVEQLLAQVPVPAPIVAVLRSFIHLGTLLTTFWCIWYALTTTFRMMERGRPGTRQSWFGGLSPRLLSCVLTAGMTLSVGLQAGETVGHALWFYALLGLIWGYACLRPTLFGGTDA
jgi:hypothetical protein